MGKYTELSWEDASKNPWQVRGKSGAGFCRLLRIRLLRIPMETSNRGD